MAETSWAHICSYQDSAAAIAGAFWPNRLVITSDASCARLAATATGCTVAARAASNSAAAARAAAAAPAACRAEVRNQPT